MNAILRYKGLAFIVSDAPADESEAEYFFEEKMCPPDVIKRTLAVIEIEDADK